MDYDNICIYIYSISIYTVIKKMSKFSPKWILNTSKCLTVVETAIASET